MLQKYLNQVKKATSKKEVMDIVESSMKDEEILYNHRLVIYEYANRTMIIFTQQELLKGIEELVATILN